MSPVRAIAGVLVAMGVVGLAWWSLAPQPDWEMEGFAMTLCPCDTPCPCRSGGAPTHGGCLATTFVEIARGRHGDVRLDGLRFVTVGEMHRAGDRTVFFESSTPPSVRDAVTAMGQAMLQGEGWTARLLAPLARWATTFREVPRIDYVRGPAGVERRVSIDGVLELHARLRATGAGEPVDAVPALDEFSNWIAYADNVVYRYRDAETGEEHDFSGRQANFKTFDVDHSDYESGELLFRLAAEGDIATLRGRLQAMRESGPPFGGPLPH